MRYPKAFEQAEGTVIDEQGRTDREVTVTVGEDRDGNAAVKVSLEADDEKQAIEAQLSREQVTELRDGLERLLEA